MENTKEEKLGWGCQGLSQKSKNYCMKHLLLHLLTQMRTIRLLIFLAVHYEMNVKQFDATCA